MRVPFRQQATEYDCVPTSILNALSYLFQRKELPPYVVHRIYKDCLDYKAARGTSSRAIMEIGHWLSCYRENRFTRFSVAASYLYGTQVHLGRNSRIISCLTAGGAVALCLQSSQHERHCMLGLRFDDDWLYCHEPHPRSRRFIDCEEVQFLEDSGDQTPNMRIKASWLEKDYDQLTHAMERKYALGSIDKRECLLLNRIDP